MAGREGEAASPDPGTVPGGDSGGGSATWPSGEPGTGFTDIEAKYMDVPWSALPLAARRAAEEIGYGKDSWDGDAKVAVNAIAWRDLGDARRRACQALGWDAAAWDHQYRESEWKDLPPCVRRVAAELGWCRETWDADEDVPVCDKAWDNLADKERRCLHVLGYWVHTWE